MSKIWSAVLVVAIVAVSLGLVGGFLANDADGEDTFVKYSFDNEGDTEMWFYSAALPEEVSGTYKFTVLESKDGEYKIREEVYAKSTISGAGIATADLMQGTSADYGKTGERVGSGSTVMHVWEYVTDEYTYQIYSTETFDENTIYRMIMIEDVDGRMTKHTISFADGLSTTWNVEYTSCTDNVMTELPYIMPLPDDFETYELGTKFGVLTVTDVDGWTVIADTGLMFQAEMGTKGSGDYVRYSITSTNIKL